ncbi:MAG TPA: sigma 54-interacting transcriptional regulator [Candidatus Methylomirabilis sp.]|nr:sigma 54-interacting transcriptional regulator [Candidatus Methylomirabilis sp.]
MDVELAGADLLVSLEAIGRAMGEEFDPRRFLQEFSQRIRGILPHDRLVVDHLDEDGRTFSVFAEHAPPGLLLHEEHYTTAFDPQGRYVVADWAIRRVFAGEAVLVHEFATDPRFGSVNSHERKLQEAGIRSGIGVPLKSGGRVIGALVATSLTPHRYDETHLDTARQVADLIAPFIQSTVLLQRERRRRGRLRALGTLTQVLATSLDARDVFARFAEAVKPILDFDLMGAVLISTSGRDLELLAKAGLPDMQGPPERIPLKHYSFTRRVEAGEAVVIQDAAVELDPTLPGDRRILEGGGRSCMTVPLRFGEQVGGGLFFGKRRPYWFDALDVELATGIASQVVVAVQHQRLAEDQKRLTLAEGRARQLEQRLTSLRQELGARYGFDRILGRAPALQEALARAAKVAPTETTVLLTGESGTGKELVARAIHYASPRAEGPYVAINCAALPETLVESELFGHERGAFTGADKQKPGRFEAAAGGTLFLDEIAELPPSAQAKLLRVLQEREFQRVGGTTTLRADVRLITATNRDLARAVAEGKFREDLFYRLNVFSVHLPPLRERGDDILLLAEHFVRELAPKLGKGNGGLSRDAQEVLRSYHWPGNIRELANAVERALILAGGELLTAAHFGLAGRKHQGLEGTGGPPAEPSAPEPLVDMERRAIRAALERTKGNKTRAAALLGISRTQLHTRLRRFGQTPESAA